MLEDEARPIPMLDVRILDPMVAVPPLDPITDPDAIMLLAQYASAIVPGIVKFDSAAPASVGIYNEMLVLFMLFVLTCVASMFPLMLATFESSSNVGNKLEQLPNNKRLFDEVALKRISPLLAPRK